MDLEQEGGSLIHRLKELRRVQPASKGRAGRGYDASVDVNQLVPERDIPEWILRRRAIMHCFRDLALRLLLLPLVSK
jgi:hypothetical protein